MSAAPSADAADLPVPDLRYAIDADDVSSGVVTDTSGHGLAGTLVNGSTAGVTDAGSGSLALTLPGRPAVDRWLRAAWSELSGGRLCPTEPTVAEEGLG